MGQDKALDLTPPEEETVPRQQWSPHEHTQLNSDPMGNIPALHSPVIIRNINEFS